MKVVRRMFGRIVDRCLWLVSCSPAAPVARCRVRLKIGNDLYCNGPGRAGGNENEPIVPQKFCR